MAVDRIGAAIGMDERGLEPTRRLIAVVRRLGTGLRRDLYEAIKHLPVAAGIGDTIEAYVQTRLGLGNLELRDDLFIDKQ